MKQWIKKYWWLPLCILFSFSLPLLVNIAFLKLNFKTGTDLNNVTWLGFWGSYLGGLLGSVAALIALFLTNRQQERYHSEEKESDRLRVLPAISCSLIAPDLEKSPTLRCIEIKDDWTIHGTQAGDIARIHNFISIHSKTSQCRTLHLKNIGLGPCFNTVLSINNLSTEDSLSVNLGGFSISEERIIF